MKLLVITSEYHRPAFEKLCQSIGEDKVWCGHDEALESMLIEEPTHILVDIDAVLEESREGAKEKARSIVRDLRQSASGGQRVLATSFLRYADIGDDLEAKDFLRMPFTSQQLQEVLASGN